MLISLLSNTILILEVPTGRGKTTISKIIFKYLGINYERIYLSPSKKWRFFFSSKIPKIENENISTKIK